MEVGIHVWRNVRGNRVYPALFMLLLTVALVSPVRGEMMVPRDSSHAYQRNPHAKLRHVLLYDAGTTHNAAKQALRNSLVRLSHRYGFQLDTSGASGYITESTLAGVDVVVFSNGDQDVLGPGESPSTIAMERFVYEKGGALLLVHAAAAFIVCADGIYPLPPNGGPPLPPGTGCRFLARAAVRQYYQHLVSGTPMTLYVDSVRAGEVPPHASLGAPQGIGPVPPPATSSHGIANKETQPVFTGLRRTWVGLEDEWWRFVSSPRLVEDIPYIVANLDSAEYVEGRVNVLLSIDERSHDWGNQRMGDHPIAWTRKMGRGLAAFNAAGHVDVYVQKDSIMEKFNGRLLRYLARDFVGCMDPAYAEYNPEASVTVLSAGFDDPEPCKALVPLRPRIETRQGGVVALAGGARRIRIALPQAGRHVIRIIDVSGETVFSRTVEGAGGVVESSALRPGIYFVRILGPGNARLVERVDLY